jgi:hypothetical protein
MIRIGIALPNSAHQFVPGGRMLISMPGFFSQIVLGRPSPEPGDVGVERLEGHRAIADQDRGRGLELARDLVVDDVDLLDVALVDLLDEARVGHVDALRPLPEVELGDEHADDDDERPQRDRSPGAARRRQGRGDAARQARTTGAPRGLLVRLRAGIVTAIDHSGDSVGFAFGTAMPT